MIKKIKLKYFNIISGIIMAAVMFFIITGNNIVYGASASVSVSTATATQGEEVKVTVQINADANIGAYNFYLEYDASILEVVSGHDGGGGGRIQLQYDVPNVENISKSLTKTITFKAIAPGTSAIKYVCVNEDDGVLDYDTTDNMAVTPADGSVTVKAPVIASKNNNLASMTVAAVRADGTSFDVNLTPGFSKDVTTYNLSLEEGITKLVIAAKTEDAKASIKIQWPNMDPGDNTTHVIVTAEDGSTKRYTIYTKVALPPETTTVPPEPITVVIDGTEHYIEDITEGVALPEGFETFEMNYNGETVVAGRGLSKDLTIVYITKGNGSAGSLYIYNEADKSFYPMVNISMTQKLYTVVKAPAELMIPAGFVSASVSINGATVDGWKNEEMQGTYLVYAMNWNGEAGLYYYDETEKQMIKYFEISVQTGGASIDEYNNLVSENAQLKNQLAEAENNSHNGEGDQLYKYIALGCGVVVIILIGIIIMLSAKNKKDDEKDVDDVDGDNEEDDDEDEGEEDDEDKDENDEVDDEEDEGEEDDEEDENKENDNEDDVADEISLTPVEDEAVMVSADEYNDTEETVETDEATENEVAEFEATEDEKSEFEATEDEKSEFEATEKDESSEALKVTDESQVADAELENDLKNAIADIFEEQEEATNEFSEEIAPVDLPKTEEISEAVELEADDGEKTTEKELSETDKKKLVEKILEDEETSIKEEDIDLVIDELFDELFGE